MADFIVQVPQGRRARILQLTDPQVIESEQERYEGRLGGLYDRWRRCRKEENLYRYIRQTVQVARPDFIFITGDLVYGEFDDTGESFLDFVSFMESFGIPWAPVFGNHDNDTRFGVAAQCAALEGAEHCRFLRRPLGESNGNYTVLLKQGDRPLRLFVFLDSGGCLRRAGVEEAQRAWYREAVKEEKRLAPDLKLSFALHIQPLVFRKAFLKYFPELIFPFTAREKGDYGYVGRDVKGIWDEDETFFKEICALGADSLFVGHEHCSNASILYQGVRLQYGQKSSTYDRFNCLLPDGSIRGGYDAVGIPLIGGSTFSLGEDGSIGEGQILEITEEGPNIIKENE